MGEQLITNQLKQIQASLNQPQSLLNLQNLLSSPQQSIQIFSSVPNLNLINQISQSLRPSLLQTSIYHLIQSSIAKVDTNIMGGSRVRSLHDCKGRFLWFQHRASDLFSLSVPQLKKTTIFQIMTTKSRRYLYKKYGKFIADNFQTRIITFKLDKCGMELSSRIRSVVYKESGKEYQMGLFCETRLARHQLVNQRKERGMIQPWMDQITLQVPTPVRNLDFDFNLRRSPGSIRVTPFLVTPEDKKEKKKSSIRISNFYD